MSLTRVLSAVLSTVGRFGLNAAVPELVLGFSSVLQGSWPSFRQNIFLVKSWAGEIQPIKCCELMSTAVTTQVTQGSLSDLKVTSLCIYVS